MWFYFAKKNLGLLIIKTYKKSEHFLNLFLVKLNNYEKVNYLFWHMVRAYGYTLGKN